jgi:hypothetical protein
MGKLARIVRALADRRRAICGDCIGLVEDIFAEDQRSRTVT